MPSWWLVDRKKHKHLAIFMELTKTDIRLRMCSEDDWSEDFDWNIELKKPGSHVYKLVHGATKEIQGVISFRDSEDKEYAIVDLLETAPVNRTKKRPFINCMHLLFAFAAQHSLNIGGKGEIAMTPKSNLDLYYIKQYKAQKLLGRDYGIFSPVTSALIRLYYK